MVVLFFLGDFVFKTFFFLLGSAVGNFLRVFRLLALECFRQITHVALTRRGAWRNFIALGGVFVPAALIFRVGRSRVDFALAFNFYERGRTHVFGDRVPDGINVKLNRRLWAELIKQRFLLGACLL